MVKRVLMIAYHFPPVKVSSGIQRTLRFAQYLPDSGWTPTVLTPHPRAYAMTSQEDMGQITNMDVFPAFALDTSKHLSIGGRYPRIAALPDRWASWWLGGVPAGLKLIRKFRPDVIWSTYPIATAHLIGLTLHRLSGIPWVADLRDPMAQDGYPTDPLIWKSFDWIEKRVVRYASAVTFTTPGALREYTHRYPDRAEKFSVIENGYDENAFAAVDGAQNIPPRNGDRPFTLVHSGVIYPEERDPRQFFEALAQLLKAGEISPQLLRIVLRATGHDEYLQKLIDQNGIASIVTLAPSIPYAEALREMTTVDALLILQAANCNDQIPAKLYECLRARRPILGLTDPNGDTGGALAAAGINTVAPLDSAPAIRETLKRFIEMLRLGNAPVASELAIANASRQGRTVAFAQLLDRIK
ncbi:MAG: glycosyltransferase [Pseudomonadota bacterium]